MGSEIYINDLLLHRGGRVWYASAENKRKVISKISLHYRFENASPHLLGAPFHPNYRWGAKAYAEKMTHSGCYQIFVRLEVGDRLDQELPEPERPLSGGTAIRNRTSGGAFKQTQSMPSF